MKSFVHKAFINLLGLSLPLVAAIVAFPILLQTIGADRFGILTLAWVVIGYFSFFDMGLGRALTRLVANNIGNERGDRNPPLIWTALSLMAGVGVLGTGILYFLTPWFVGTVLKIPGHLHAETMATFYLLAMSVPVVIATAGLSGVLEAHLRFGLINAVRIPMGILTFIGPLLVLPYSNSLDKVVAVLLMGRLLMAIVYLTMCIRIVPNLRRTVTVDLRFIKPLASYGGWLTVSNIIGPILLYADRFVIASLVSLTATAYYTTPFEVITKLLLIPSAILGVMFPTLATSLVQSTAAAKGLYRHAMWLNIGLMLAPCVLILIFADVGLELWLGTQFAESSFRIAQLLVVGVFINSIGLMSQSLVQAAGRPDLTAKLHLCELILYCGYAIWLISWLGAIGAATAWVVRVSISAIVLALMAERVLQQHAMLTVTTTED